MQKWIFKEITTPNIICVLKFYEIANGIKCAINVKLLGSKYAKLDDQDGK